MCRTCCRLFVGLVGLSLISGSARAQQAGTKPETPKKADEAKKEAAKPAAAAQAAMGEKEKAAMEAMAKVMAPGDNHKLLDAMIGEWTTVAKCRMNANTPWDETTGTCTSKWILGGRFVQSEMKGTMMGQPFTGVSTEGYDNMKNKFVGTWMSDMCTSTMVSEGTYDPSSKTFTYTTQVADPMQGGAMVKVRYTIKVVDKNSHIFEWFETQEGKEVKTMEITYTRKPVS